MIETHGVPTVTFCTHPFRTLSTVRKEALGLPALPIVWLPHPMMTRSPAEIEQFADQVLDEVVRILTQEVR
ncbi:MAG TPA: hypothetical protein VEA40_11285 [Ramlibacter sp.]|nr:hypothetical protein [Ramlibacter sp.]